MRVFIFVLVLVALVYLCEAKKHKKKDHSLVEGQKIQGIHKAPSANPFHRGKKYHKGGRLRGRHLFGDKKGKKRGKHDKWMRFPMKKSACKTLTCDPKQFCMVHPSNGAEKCINKQDFKQGRRLFKQFHRQRKVLKNEDEIKRLEAELAKGEHIKDVFDLMNHHVKSKYGEHKKWKKLHQKRVEQKQDRMFKEATNEHECRATEIGELKKRMVGWFDVVHTESRQEHHHGENRGKHQKIRNLHEMKKEKDLKPVFNALEKMNDVKTVHEQHGGHKKHHRRFQRSVHDTVEKESHGGCMCSKSVMWEFRKQDISVDGHLEEREMIVMKSNRREPCMKPLLKSCDKSGDGKLTRGEWCCCFQALVAPCLEKKELSHPDDWVPSCDNEGYFEREQCHKSGHCWCVDLNGNKIENTETKGKADCGKYGPNGYLNKTF